MIQVRPFTGLGGFRNEWLNARHHFSFGHYHDPERMGFGRLRVWNDDEVAPGTGFDPHPHREMEIVTYIREGAITHRDNLGNEGRTEAGDVQVMHAGTGIVHAEYNREAGADTVIPDLDTARPPRRRRPAGRTRQSPREGRTFGAGERPRAGCRKWGTAAECRCGRACGHAAPEKRRLWACAGPRRLSGRRRADR